MLSKLFKHEFRTFGRYMLPEVIALLLLGPASGIALRFLDSAESSTLANTISVIVVCVFFCTMFAILVVSLVMMIERFYKNLMGSEGYFMFTLPATVDELIWSKLLVSTLWIIIAAASCGIAVLAMVLVGGSGYEDLSFVPVAIKRVIQEIGGGNIMMFCLEGILIIVVATFASCLRFYLAMAIGYSFPNNKGILSVVFYFVIGFVLQALGAILGISAVKTGLTDMIVSFTTMFNDTITIAHGGLIGLLLGTTLVGVVLYFPTRYFLKNKLNLA